MTRDEPRHQAVPRAEDDCRREASFGGRFDWRGARNDLTIDPEQRRLLAGAAQHVVLAAERDAEVPVGDPTLELARSAESGPSEDSSGSRIALSSPTENLKGLRLHHKAHNLYLHHMRRRGANAVTLEELRAEVGTGAIDTVLLAMTDMQGRLQGKRLTAHALPRRGAEHGAEGCNYLLAVDVDMNTVDGYAMSSWERGYGDFVLRPDLETLRPVPWQEGTVMLPRRRRLARRLRRARLAATDPAPPARAAGRARLERQRRHRARVHRLPRHLRGGVAEGLPRPASRPTSTTSTTRCSAPRGSSR